MSGKIENVEACEAQYRSNLLDQILGGEKYYHDHAHGTFEGMREHWMAPQCAVLDYLIHWLEARRGIEAGELQPFLELGGFTAHLSGFLATRFGLAGSCGDLDKSVIERSFREILPRIGLKSEGLTAVDADASHLNFADNSLAMVFCFATLHHFADPVACFREIWRVLRPGGVFLCAREPVQPLWRRSRKTTDCSEVQEGLIENVFSVEQYDRMIESVFGDYVSMPYDEVRIPALMPWFLRSMVGRKLNGKGYERARRFIYSRLGGQDYSVLAFKS